MNQFDVRALPRAHVDPNLAELSHVRRGDGAPPPAGAACRLLPAVIVFPLRMGGASGPQDDSRVMRLVTSQMHSLGYHVTTAVNGPWALEFLPSEKAVDLLFTDIVMPGGMNGPQLAQAALKIRPDLKVLYNSSYTQNAIVHQGRLDQGVNYLSKPYRRSDPARKLRQVLDAPA